MIPVAPRVTPTINPTSVVIIGASTGGTRVVPEILAKAGRLRACVLVVQHMPKFINQTFTRALADCCAMPVRLAQDLDPLEEGIIYVAPSESHCTVLRQRRLHVNSGAKVNFVCPSIDVTMLSLRKPAQGHRLVGVVLTGMGRDGAEGIVHMKELGAVTVAQDKRSCAVHGMPDEAACTGCVDYVLSPDDIATLLRRLLGW